MKGRYLRNFTKKLYPTILVLTLFLNLVSGLVTYAASIPTIYIVGDSLTCDYDSETDFPRQGWGYFFKELVDGAIVVNASESGEDTNTCYTSGRFENRVYNNLKSGDYVLINLGTNDSDDKRGISTDAYGENLEKFATDIRGKGAYPVFVTPPTGHAYEWTRSWAYVQKMKDVADSKNIPLVDLNSVHNAYVKNMVPDIEHGDLLPDAVLRDMHVKAVDEEWNLSESEKTQFLSKWGEDTVHFNVNGAEKLAAWVSDLICDSENRQLVKLASYINKSKSVKDGVTVTFENVDCSETVTGYKAQGTVRRRIGRGFEPITVIFGVYSSNGAVKSIGKTDLNFTKLMGDTVKAESGFSAQDFEITVACEKENDDQIKVFVWGDTQTLVPQHNAVEKLDTTLTYTEKANGVVLEWEAVAGVESYNVYRDGTYLGTVDDTVFIDKYFDTIEQMRSEDRGLLADTTKNHTYCITDGKNISNSIKATADTSLIKYITFDEVTTGQTIEDINSGSNGITLLTNKDRVKLVKKMNAAKTFTTESGTEFTTPYYTTSYPHIANPYMELGFTDTKGVQKNALALFTSSNSSDNSASVEKWQSEPWFKVDSFNDAAQKKYTILMNASINYDSPFSIPKITKRSTDNYLTASDITGNTDKDENQISVVSADGARDNISCYTLYRNSFKPGEYTGEFATYIFDLYACFGDNGPGASGGPTNGTISNLQLFKDNDFDNFASIHSLAVVKSDDFIRETVEYNKLPQLYLVGDSIVATWPEQWYPQQGWGHSLKQYFDGDKIKVNNVAVAGQSARSYYHQYYNSKLGDSLKAGDYVMISFGTNDATHSGTYTYDNQTWNIRTSVEDYADVLGTYVENIRAKGAYPIFVTIANNGNTYDSNSAYVEKMLDVAEDMSVPCIDLHQLHNNYMQSKSAGSISDAVKRELFMFDVKNTWKLSDDDIAAHPNSSVANGGNDLTHTNENGARKLAEMIVDDIQASDNSVLQQLSSYVLSIEAIDINLAATEKANGVSLRWDSVLGVDSYDVYRDGTKIATVTDAAYDDVYFNSVEELNNSSLINTEHSYYVVFDADQISGTVKATANTALIKYITFDNAEYSKAGINAGAHGIEVATKDASDNDLELFTIRAKTGTDPEVYTSKYISTQTYRKYNEAFVGNIDGQNALGQVMYQYRKYVNGVLTLDANQVTRPILDVDGFDTQDDYTIIMTADIKTDNYTIAGVEKDNTKDSFADKTIADNKVTVVGGKDITASNGVFSPGVNKNRYATYIYDMNTKFDGKYGDIRFSNTDTAIDETAAIRSFGIVKKTDFIMPNVEIDELGLTVTEKANGVILSWQPIYGVDAYQVFRDDVEIASATDTQYADIYYSTLEDIQDIDEHEYYVKVDDIQSKTITASADTTLIKYITFDAASNSKAGINAGAQGIEVATKDASDNDLELFTIRAKTGTDPEVYTSKYISTQTYRKYNEAFVGNIDGQNALGQVMYQYRKYVNGVLTLDANQVTRPILDVDGFNVQDDYTIIMTADIKTDNYTIAGVEKDNTKDSFADKTIADNKVTVVGGKDITASNGVFNPGANKNRYTTYIYDMNTKFDGKYGDIRFSNTDATIDETAAIRSFGVVKKTDFIMPIASNNILRVDRKANAVILSWDEIEGVSEYDIYKDDVKVATVDGTHYVDKYFDTIEGIESVTNHTYYIAYNEEVSDSVIAKPNTALIKYISFDDAEYTASDINAGAHGVEVATKDANGNDLELFSVREKNVNDEGYTSKYISPMTYRKYNEVYLGDFNGQTALGLVSYQYKTYVNGVLTLQSAQVTRPILDVDGFDTYDNYTVIMTANVMTDSFSVPGIENNGGESFSNRTVYGNKVKVVNGSDIQLNSSGFNPGANKNKFATYIYDVNMKFDGSYGDIRFSGTSASTDETAAIRSFGVVKRSDFIYDYIEGENSERIYYEIPTKCASQTVVDSETGNSIQYMNIFGNEALKPYVTQQAWTSDGKSFIVAMRNGQNSGPMFLYNTENEILTYIDDVSTDDLVLNGTVGPDDKVYYVKKPANKAQLWRYDIAQGTKEFIVDGGADSSFYFPHVSNDAKYVSIEYTYPELKEVSPREYSIARLNLQTNEFDIDTHHFEYSNKLDHVQINPAYKDLILFAHDTADGISGKSITDRIWRYNFANSEKTVLFDQGSLPNGDAYTQATHEIWSRDGEYVYFVIPPDDENVCQLARIDKNGENAQYYGGTSGYRFSHLSPTADNKFLVADGPNYMTLVNTATGAVSEISTVNLYENKFEHPYHPHPIVATGAYKVNWGMINDNVLGIGWYDFSDLQN